MLCKSGFLNDTDYKPLDESSLCNANLGLWNYPDYKPLDKSHSCWHLAGTHYTHATLSSGCQCCLRWRQIYPDCQDQAKCSLCHVMSWLLSPTVSNLHDRTYKLLDCWNPWRQSAAARVMWNTAPVCVAVCMSLGKWLHTLRSHPTLGENQER